MRTVTNLNNKVYYQGRYWNDIPVVRDYMFKNFTDDSKKWWIEDFKEKYAKVPFEHALFLNCGDGRWEGEFIDNKIVKRVTAFDVSPTLIKKAKKLKGNRPIQYILADANKIKLKKNTFDLVVNIAALHHTQYLNRLLKLIAESLKKYGYFVSFDYVGPHRNQYPLHNWILIKIINNLLPPDLRKPNFGYPNLPTMLVTDPTEAIHSDLIGKTIKRYFNIVKWRNTGGGIAYEIFTHNPKLTNKVLSKKKAIRHINKVLFVDNLLTKIKIVPVFFSYIVTQPKKNILENKSKIQRFQQLENIREKYSMKLLNTYTLFDYLIMLKHRRPLKAKLILVVKYITYTPLKLFEILLGYLH